jgi:hypothetical protein
MNLVLGFTPFIVFAILTRLSADLALWAAFAAAFVVTIRDFVESPSLRLLDGGSFALFGGLALYRGFLEPGLSLAAVRTIADLGLLAVIAFSLVARRPFSLQYASAETRGQSWPPSAFLRTNYIISAVWLAAFAVMAAADAAVTLYPELPLYTAIAASVAALAFAITFTLRYPARAHARLGKA